MWPLPVLQQREWHPSIPWSSSTRLPASWWGCMQRNHRDRDPTCTLMTHLHQNTCLGTCQRHCWPQLPIVWCELKARHHLQVEDRTDWSRETYTSMVTECAGIWIMNEMLHINRIRINAYVCLPVWVAVSVVVTQQVILSHGLVSGNFQWLINAWQQVFRQIWYLKWPSLLLLTLYLFRPNLN